MRDCNGIGIVSVSSYLDGGIAGDRCVPYAMVKLNKILECKIVNIFLPIIFIMFWKLKKCLIEA